MRRIIALLVGIASAYVALTPVETAHYDQDVNIHESNYYYYDYYYGSSSEESSQESSQESSSEEHSVNLLMNLHYDDSTNSYAYPTMQG